MNAFQFGRQMMEKIANPLVLRQLAKAVVPAATKAVAKTPVAPDPGVAVNAAGQVMSNGPISAVERFRHIAAGLPPLHNAPTPPPTLGR